MDIPTIAQVALRLIFFVVGVGLVVVLVRVIQILTNVNKTVEDMRKQLTPTLENVEKLTTQAQPLLENVNNLVESADPMMDRINLTVDALNLELMRVDGILEDVSDITSGLSGASTAVDTITNAPLKLVNNASNMVREAVKPRRASNESISLGEKKAKHASKVTQEVVEQASSEEEE